MEEELKYTSKFDGPTTDEVLEHAKSVKDLTIPSLSNISGFVCIDNEGKAIGMMSKEQVAQVVGGLLPIKRLSSEQKYPVSVPALSQVNIELKSEYTYLISVEYPYSDSSALLYIPQTRHKIYSITSDLPSGIVFSLGEDGNLVISSTNYPYGLKVTLLAF